MSTVSAFIPYTKVGAERWSWLLLLPLVLLSLPILVIVGSALAPWMPEPWTHLWRTVLAEYVSNSLWLGLGVVCGTLALGVLPAWLVTMCRFPGCRWWGMLLALPLAFPAYILAYVYTGLLDGIGPLPGLALADNVPGIRSLTGATLVLSLALYPYVYLLSRAAFNEQSYCALEAARTLGCSGVQAFLRVGLPLAKPAIVAGVLLALMETLADYGTVQHFSLAVFTTGIFRIWNGMGDSVTAAQMSFLLLSFVILLFFLERGSRQRARYYTADRHRPLPTVPLRGWAGWSACCVCALPVLCGFLLPCAVLLLWAARSFREQLGAELLGALLNSLLLALITSVLALVLAASVYMGRRLQGGAVARFSLLAVRFGYAVPGTVVAVGLLIPALWLDSLLAESWGWLTGASLPLLLVGSLPVLIFAYLVRFLTVSLNTLEASMDKIGPSLGEAGRCLGLRPPQVFRRIYLPLMRSGLLAALLLVFVEVLKELPATLLLRPFDFSTLALRTYELANEERLIDAACPALAIVLISLVPILLLSHSIEHVRPRS